MPVTTTHLRYDEHSAQWQRLRDAFAGQDAVKRHHRQEDYLPRLEGHDGKFSDDYTMYLFRALWTGFSQRTLTGIVGAVFRKDPKMTFPDADREWLEDITLTGQSMIDFARLAFREVMALNWAGVLVDMMGEEHSLPEERRPTLQFYRAEAIRNWRIEPRNGKPTLTQVVLHETFDEPAKDKFGTEQGDQYRVLSLDTKTTISAAGISSVSSFYTQQLWRKQRTADNREEWRPFGPIIIPHRKGDPLPHIPFFPLSVNGQEFRLEPSRLLDLVDVNYDHYRLDADYKHGLHFTALPTVWMAGFPVDGTYRIGSQVAWVSENPAARAGFAEFSGSGLNAILDAKASDERLMAVLGARLLEESKRAVEASEAIQLRQAGEESIVKTAARAVSAVLSTALYTMAWWGGQDTPEAGIQLNTDIVAAQMSPTMITALLGALQANHISERTFLEALVTGEVVQGRTWEEEQELIALTDPAGDMEVA